MRRRQPGQGLLDKSGWNGQNYVRYVLYRFFDASTDPDLSRMNMYVAEVVWIMVVLAYKIKVLLVAEPPFDPHIVFGQNFNDGSSPATTADDGDGRWLFGVGWFQGSQRVSGKDRDENGFSRLTRRLMTNLSATRTGGDV